ncbi:phosphotransferase family protein [Rhodococcus sp. USK10]|uniref:phosphotransferase family protein n=1 Tax=Rhodococcus sp. USK10 TaxID=2789739 RepID=UPI001C6023EB|nr:phosphotransferase family protein [Rhodococcus sp. USK10]QYB06910.1 phosphotransferase family protein [Rhodococcus sp. USK10]
MTADNATDGLQCGEGIDLFGVRRWLREHIGGFDGPGGELSASLIAGGRSNLTYLLSRADGRRLVLRRPPLGHVLATAHDVAREHRILSALQGTQVPVPELVGSCDDPTVIGAPFYVMGHVDGQVVRRTADVHALLDENGCRSVGLELAGTLARIHEVDPDGVGLGSLGRRDDYLERQLTRWMKQYIDTQTDPVPDVDRAHQRLVALRPPQRRTTIVHGDYRIDNVIVSRSGEVRAVLDWELCTLGDPLADLGQMMLRTSYTGKIEDGVPQPPLSDVPGFASAEDILSAYSSASGADVSDVSYYIAFAAWKTACIQQGVYVRQRAGVMLGGSRDAGAVRDGVRRRASDALHILAGMQ